MSLEGSGFRNSLKIMLGRLGLLAVVRRLKKAAMLALSPKLRRKEAATRALTRELMPRFNQFKAQYGQVLRQNIRIVPKNVRKKVLFCGVGHPGVETEIGIIKALEFHGGSTTVVTHHFKIIEQKYYKLAAASSLAWEEYLPPQDLNFAQRMIDDIQTIPDLMKFNFQDVRVGQYAIATAMRILRVGGLDLNLEAHRQVLVNQLASSICYAVAAQAIVREVKPQYSIFVDGVYSPEGEFVDACLANGVDTVSYNVGHKSNTLMLKRYRTGIRDHDRFSLSEDSWNLMRNIPWSEELVEKTNQEITRTYASGDWFSSTGTEFNKQALPPAEVKKVLGLNPNKKTAIIFPHIFWDASLSRGVDLYKDYEEWFIETVRAACRNDTVNWVVKIHPAHVGKAVMEGFRGEPAEVISLRENIGDLPGHISFIPADSEISTISLFEVMDYCLTVRGTIGIEAARFGIPVITAGTGRYNQKGFTIESDTREQYLEKLANISAIPPLTSARKELAQRYAYGLFVLRPLPIKSIHMEFKDQETYVGKFGINIQKKGEWLKAGDLQAFSKWVLESQDSDYLAPF